MRIKLKLKDFKTQLRRHYTLPPIQPQLNIQPQNTLSVEISQKDSFQLSITTMSLKSLAELSIE
ncbi:hypothetical protein SS50377_24137 [Spironucleus salmonicida]|uniref:Uncharacterized protein n=1 Tax=Spironucleus salmonicida TaxID=348837 RepID=V6LWQ8_9EUKA|nr:hypothetical protein SS50377_24137 [Spironucleus salmonicida]|eukprot:EST49020.1 Hypothetical protein SS50377_10712 [Spironucleus salmonicida]